MIKIKRGVLLVISSPSGTGKTTICKKLLEYDKYPPFCIGNNKKKRKMKLKE